MVVAACGSANADASFAMREFSISGPERLGAGAQQVTATNEGEFPHTLVITGADGEVVGASGLIQPGESVALSVELTPGMFAVTCRIVAQNDAGDLIDHYESGMNTLIKVSG